MKKALWLLSLIMMMSCCKQFGNEEIVSYQDSLKSISHAHDSLLIAVKKASDILDRIDLKRGNTTTLMEKNKPITDRLDELKEYVRFSEERINQLEKDLKAARIESNAYSMMVDAFRSEILLRDLQVKILTDSATTPITSKTF